jgi:hypothetical protein
MFPGQDTQAILQCLIGMKNFSIAKWKETLQQSFVESNSHEGISLIYSFAFL